MSPLPTVASNGTADYLAAATLLWGDAGRFAVETFARLNRVLFTGELPSLPIVIGITAYGHCIGLTRHQVDLPRITLASNLFARGRGAVVDVLAHEMVHAKLMLAGLDPAHNGRPWCAEIERLSPLVLGCAVKAAPVNPRRIDGHVTRRALDGHLTRKQLARWPQSLREPGHDLGAPIHVPSY